MARDGIILHNVSAKGLLCVYVLLKKAFDADYFTHTHIQVRKIPQNTMIFLL